MSSEAIVALIVGITTGVVALLGSTGTVVWAVSRQFSDNRKVMYEGLEKLGTKIMDKLDYHEKHDDERFADVAKSFQNVSDQIWDLKVTSATKNAENLRERNNKQA